MIVIAHGPSTHNVIRFTLFHSVPLLAGKLISDVKCCDAMRML